MQIQRDDVIFPQLHKQVGAWEFEPQSLWLSRLYFFSLRI